MWGSWDLRVESSSWKRGTILFSYKKSKSFIHSGTMGLGPYKYSASIIQIFLDWTPPPTEYPKGTNGSVWETSKSRFLSPGAHEMTQKKKNPLLGNNMAFNFKATILLSPLFYHNCLIYGVNIYVIDRE